MMTDLRVVDEGVDHEATMTWVIVVTTEHVRSGCNSRWLINGGIVQQVFMMVLQHMAEAAALHALNQVRDDHAWSSVMAWLLIKAD
jgi:hypothetical protein